ncbi:uncharacterized protein LOC143983219 isoform X2 [Lithobates pipiens]
MFPMITEPKKNTVLAVLPGSDIDLNCSADLGDMIEGIFTQIFWIINGNFTDCYDKVNESNVIVTKKGNFTYMHLVLHIYKVTAEFYNVPITCELQTTSGNDMSTVYFTPLTTEPWAIIMLVILIVLCLLAVCPCMYYRTVKNAAR